MKFTKIAYKSEENINSIIKKFGKKIERLEGLKTTCYDFDIELNSIQINMINEKIRYYTLIYNDIIRYNHWKFKDNCEGDIYLFHLDGFCVEELNLVKKQENRQKIMNRII